MTVTHVAVAAALRAFLPAAVELSAAGPEDRPGPLLDTEADAIAGASQTRRLEFALGRTCARDAMARLGVPGLPIPVGDSREPQWPSGVIGSITHCRGFCAAAVSSEFDVQGIGIDVEPKTNLSVEIADMVATPEECTRAPAIVLFSVKEAIFKSLWPMTQTWLDFSDVRVSVDLPAGSFVARVLAAIPDFHRPVITGHCAVVAGFVASAITMPPPGGPHSGRTFQLT